MEDRRRADSDSPYGTSSNTPPTISSSVSSNSPDAYMSAMMKSLEHDHRTAEESSMPQLNLIQASLDSDIAALYSRPGMQDIAGRLQVLCTQMKQTNALRAQLMHRREKIYQDTAYFCRSQPPANNQRAAAQGLRRCQDLAAENARCAVETHRLTQHCLTLSGRIREALLQAEKVAMEEWWREGESLG